MSSLAESLRPQKLSEIIGQNHVKKAIQSYIDKDSFPSCYLFSGPPGTGKTSAAWILARAAQGETEEEGFDIRQNNGGDKRKIEDARILAADSMSRPFSGRYRVFIIDEAHQMTSDALSCLLIPMEVSPFTLWILCSSKPQDLPADIRSRCAAATFEFRGLDKSGTSEICSKVLAPLKMSSEQPEIEKFLFQHDVRLPREILGVLELYLSGVPLEECIKDSSHEPLYRDVASAVLNGNWTKCSATLEQIKTADYRGMIGIVSAFLAGALLQEPVGTRGDALATCLVALGSSSFQDGVAYAATKAIFYKCCKALGGSK